MKKIKYGNKKFEAENRQLDNLKENDEICEAVLDTFSDDYLSYITHLVKNTKTPSKTLPLTRTAHHSSDEEPPHKAPKAAQHHTHKPQTNMLEPKVRRHSEASAKQTHPAREVELKKQNRPKNESTKVSPRGRPPEEANKEVLKESAPKNKKRKMEYIHNQLLLKNEQKTMEFSRNTLQQTKFREDEIEPDKDAHKKSRVTHKSRQKYYVTSQNYDDTDHEPSIDLPFRQRKEAEQDANFIDNITQYITTLEENDSLNFPIRNTEEDRLMKKLQRQKRQRAQEEQEQELHEVFKENLKLSKIVKSYQQKTTELEEDITQHLAHCKNREKTYKSKINYLLQGLIQAFIKIDAQKEEITALKDLHRSYGQKLKQVDIKYEDDDFLEDYRKEIYKNFAPKRHSSELRTKHKKVLESTLPKYDEDRRFW